MLWSFEAVEVFRRCTQQITLTNILIEFVKKYSRPMILKKDL